MRNAGVASPLNADTSENLSNALFDGLRPYGRLSQSRRVNGRPDFCFLYIFVQCSGRASPVGICSTPRDTSRRLDDDQKI